MNQFVGQSEANIRKLFSRAAAAAPCVIFFDEIDALVPKRGSDHTSHVHDKVVNQMLACLSGFSDRRQVFVIAATNRPVSLLIRR